MRLDLIFTAANAERERDAGKALREKEAFNESARADCKNKATGESP